MVITPVQKTALLVGVLIIVGGAAFVYLDPLDLDLLGTKQSPVVVKPLAPPHVPAPAAKPATTKPAAAPAVKPHAAEPSEEPSEASAPAAEMSTEATETETPGATTPAEESAQGMQPTPKPAKMTKTASKPVRPKNQDLRHCLELGTDAAIAKCAGE